jgi:UDPglucose--hexose-1-phosphate uridylyltransferase
VVQNLYPVVGGTEGATGQSEVVVFGAHDLRLEDLETDEVAEILTVIRDRVADQSARRTSVQVFVNAEGEAGASIAHPHAQIIGLDFVPPAVVAEFAMIETLGADPLERDWERADRDDLVVVDGPIAAWCPWGTTTPFIVRIAPRATSSRFVDMEAHEVNATARVVRDILRAVNDELASPAYNVVIFPDQSRGDLVRRWRIEVVPRITVGGGFEIGTAVSTHATDPATAAAGLRARLRAADAASSAEPAPSMRSHS